MERVLADVSLEALRPSPNINTFGDLVNIVVRNATVVAGLISFALLVFGGLGVIIGAGGGDPKRIEQGQKTIVGAVGGLILILIAVWVVRILEAVTGKPVLQFVP
jgi:hypothetical protein